METVLPALIIAFLLLYALLTPAQSYLSAQDRIETSGRANEARLLDRARTDLAPIGAQISDDGVVVELTVRNAGQTKLTDFDQWDMILQYYDTAAAYHIVRVPYEAGNQAALNTWSVVGISRDAYDPGIFNPGETITVQLKVSPAVGPETTNRVVLATPSGIGISSVFIGPPLPPTPTPTLPAP